MLAVLVDVHYDDAEFARGDKFRLVHTNARSFITGRKRRRLRQLPPARHATQGE
jgi:hypothetical protein